MDSDAERYLLNLAYKEEARLKLRLQILRRVIDEYETDTGGAIRSDLYLDADLQESNARSEPTPDCVTVAQSSVSHDPSPSNPLATTVLSESAADLGAAAINSRAHAAVPVSPPTPARRDGSRRGRYTRKDSQGLRIRSFGVEYLVQKGKRATGGEIYQAFVAKGGVVGGKTPIASFSAALTSSRLFDNVVGAGYGLREWSTGEPQLG